MRRVARVRAAELPVGGGAVGGAGSTAGALGRLHRAAPAPHPALGESKCKLCKLALRTGQRSARQGARIPLIKSGRLPFFYGRRRQIARRAGVQTHQRPRRNSEI